MNSLLALLRANTGLLVMVMLATIGTIVFGTFAVALGAIPRRNLTWMPAAFQVERGRVLGLQFDEAGKPVPKLDYAWRFDAQEMKAPLTDAVTRAG